MFMLLISHDDSTGLFKVMHKYFKITILLLSKSYTLVFIFLFIIFSFTLLSSSLLSKTNNNILASFFNYNLYNHEVFAQYAVAPISPTGPTLSDPNLKAELILPNSTSKAKTGMAFLGPNDILVLEKTTGKVYRILNGKLLPKPVLDVTVAPKIERGLLGIAVAPNVTPDGKRYVYLYYTQAGGSKDGDEFTGSIPPLGNVVYRYEFVNGQLVNPLQLMDLPADPGITDRPDHIGGKVAIGPDGNVYAVIGEVGGHQTKAQNDEGGGPADGVGGILRATPDGQFVPNGPFGKKAPLSLYFAYGIRNSFGLAFDPVSGNLWDTENGPNYGDEINLVVPGFNSGWNLIQGYAKDSKEGHTDPSDLVKLSKSAVYADPKFEWADPVGPTALVFLNSDKLGAQYKNDLFVGDINNGNIYHFKLSADRTELLSPSGQPIEKTAITSQQIPSFKFGQGFGGITDLRVGPDGYLYVLTLSGNIFRIVPSSVASTTNNAFSLSLLQPQNKVTTNVADVKNKVIIVGVKGLQSYDPNPINIKVGDTITWTNADVVSHTVTSGKDYNAQTSGKLFNSGGIISNGVFSQKFDKAGAFDYFCLFHPDMKGQIIVSK
jgi:aldose sugar dehydrogenase